MADVMSHRGDGVEDPPQQPPHRLDSACEFGEIHHALVLLFMENVECTMQPIWNNTKYFTCLIGNQERSSKNKANRVKAKYPNVQGSKSFSAARDDKDSETQQWPGIIVSFRTFHTFQDGNWVNPQATGDYVRTFK
ncbi:putative transposase [Abeliophyllum distichum]|uniref:Transposase n=1 Tax=Abeliophyllum distichum TaxID=126358 RepID=A0ABD1SAX0_9LAMI